MGVVYHSTFINGQTSRQKINKETYTFNDTLDQMYLIDIYWAFYPKATNRTFSYARGTFSSMDHMLEHKLILSKFKNIENISSIISSHSARSFKIKFRKKTVRSSLKNFSILNINRWGKEVEFSIDNRVNRSQPN